MQLQAQNNIKNYFQIKKQTNQNPKTPRNYTKEESKPDDLKLVEPKPHSHPCNLLHLRLLACKLYLFIYQ